ncbi:hypothetical protein F5Y11DRAFT_102623 [Daldinia sp. FL1419]|nr:hypothetical protein F5Y11DRAFT_102623 [Daldinia sp. FL1419]
MLSSSYRRLRLWPDKPLSLRSGVSRPSQITYNFILILLTLACFVFAGLLGRCDGMLSDTDLVRKLAEASRYGPTIFPVVYALVVGGALRSLALWRLQDGEKVGFLDLLIGSTSVGGMIGTQLERRLTQFDVHSLCLLIIWALSPLGGQASFRIITYRDIPIPQNLTLDFLDFSNASSPVALSSVDIVNLLDVIDSSFVSSLVSSASISQSPMDPWGNIKIPFIENLPGYDSANEDEWIPYSGYTETTPYSSLIGVPVSNIPKTGNTEFTVEASYWNIRCPEFGSPEGYDDEYWFETIFNASAGCTLGTLQCTIFDHSISLPDGLTTEGARSPWGWIMSLSRESDRESRCTAASTDDIPQRQLFVRTRNTGAHKPTAANCTMGTTNVEASVNCNGWDCKVDRVRRSQKPKVHQSPSYTIFDRCSPWDSTMNLPNFLNYLIDAAGSDLSRSVGPGLFQNYLVNPDAPFAGTALHSYYIDSDITPIGNESFAIRFSQMLNSYWTSFYNFNLTYGGHPENLAFSTDYYTGYPIWGPLADTAGVNTHMETHFFYHRGWMAVLVISVTTMFLSGIVKAIVDLRIWIPDLLMNVSTMIRGNTSNCPSVPYGGTALDDSERSRLLKNLKVRYGNIRPQDDNPGELGIGELAEGEGKTTRVRLDETYW